MSVWGLIGGIIVAANIIRALKNRPWTVFLGWVLVILDSILQGV